EIKQAIGVDVVAIIKDVANSIIGLFVGAYDAVVVAWDNLPVAFTGIGKRAWNAFIEEFEKPALTINGQTIIPGLDLTAWKADLSDIESDTTDAIGRAFSNAQGVDYIDGFVASIVGAFGTAGDAVSGFNDLVVTGTTDALDGAGK